MIHFIPVRHPGDALHICANIYLHLTIIFRNNQHANIGLKNQFKHVIIHLYKSIKIPVQYQET